MARLQHQEVEFKDIGEGVGVRFDGKTIYLRDIRGTMIQLSPDNMAQLMNFVWEIVSTVEDVRRRIRDAANKTAQSRGDPEPSV